MRNIEDNPAISMDNDIPSLLSLRKQMMPPLPPTKKGIFFPNLFTIEYKSIQLSFL